MNNKRPGEFLTQVPDSSTTEKIGDRRTLEKFVGAVAALTFIDLSVGRILDTESPMPILHTTIRAISFAQSFANQ